MRGGAAAHASCAIEAKAGATGHASSSPSGRRYLRRQNGNGSASTSALYSWGGMMAASWLDVWELSRGVFMSLHRADDYKAIAAVR